MWRARGTWEERKGEDPRRSYRRGKEVYGRAIGLDAGDPSIPYNRWNAWAAIGVRESARGEDGSTAYEAALAMVGNAYPALRDMLARARAKLGRSRVPWVDGRAFGA